MVCNAFRTWPRHRWKGHKQSICRIGLLANMNNLLRDVYTEFLHINYGSREVFIHGEQLMLGDVDAVPELGQGNVSGVQDPNAALNWAEVNRANRKAAYSFVNSNPGQIMVYSLQCSAPLAIAMDTYIAFSTEVFDTRQSAKALSPVASASELKGAAALLAGRSWPLLETSRSSVEIEALRHLEQLSGPENFVGYPAAWRTISFNHDIFKLMSREGSVLYAFGVHAHRGYEYLLWRSLEDPEATAAVNATCHQGRGR
jgi:hypothetical protein